MTIAGRVAGLFGDSSTHLCGRYRSSSSTSCTSLMLATPLAALPAAAQDSQPTPRIVVTGEGSATIAPDMAVLTLTVLREGKTAREALDANSVAMQDVLDAMKAEGVEERDLQTANFSIEPQYYYPPRKSSGEAE